MKASKYLTATLAFALLVAANASAAAPDARGAGDAFGSGAFGLEPNPPAPTKPNPSIPTADLGVVLELITSGMNVTDKVTLAIPENPVTLEILADRSLVAQVVSTDTGATKKLVLPPMPDGQSLDFTALLTPASLVIDRAGENTHPDFADEWDKDSIRDASMPIWGLVESLGGISDLDAGTATHKVTENPEQVRKPSDVDVTAIRWNMVPDVDTQLEAVLIDPEDSVVIGNVTEFEIVKGLTPGGIPDISGDCTSGSASAMESKLTSASSTEAVTLNTVLSSLGGLGSGLGAVDIPGLAAGLVGLDMEFCYVPEPTPGDGMFYDPTLNRLAVLGELADPVAFLHGEEKLQFDNDLVTALKDQDSIKDTAFKFVNEDVVVAKFDHLVGNYKALLDDRLELIKNDVGLHVVTDMTECDWPQAADDSGTTAFKAAQICQAVSGVDAGAVSSKAGSFLNRTRTMTQVDGLGLLPGLINPDVKGAIVGTPEGRLGDFPDLSEYMAEPGAVVGYVQFPPSAAPKLGEWSLPENGIGSAPNIASPSVNPETPDFDVNTPDLDSTALDGIFESFQAPATTNLATIVPVSEVTGMISTVTDVYGNGLSMIPLDVLQDLPIGTTSVMKFRFVGESGSIFSGTGISGVTATITSVDPLGLSERQESAESNSNGYVVVPLASLGDFKVVATHESYQQTEGHGQAPAPGQEGGQEYTMSSASGNAAQDFASNNSLFLVMALAALAVGFLLVRRNGGLKIGRGGRR